MQKGYFRIETTKVCEQKMFKAKVHNITEAKVYCETNTRKSLDCQE